MIYVGQELLIPGELPDRNNNGADSGNDQKEGQQEIAATVRGEVIISNKTRTAGSVGPTEIKSYQVLPLENQQLPVLKESEIIVKYKSLVSSQAVKELEQQNDLVTLGAMETDVNQVVHYQVPESKDIKELITYYNELDTVLWAEPNYIYYPLAIPADPYYNYHQWNLVNMNMEAAWDQQKGDDSVIVAVLDTGVIPRSS